MKPKKVKITKQEPKTEDYNNLDFDAMENMMSNQNIDQLIEMLKLTKGGNNSNIMNLDTSFIENHENGVEMFLRTAIKLEPKNPEHHYNYALFLETQHQYSQARGEFEKAIKFDKKNDIFRTDYANLLFKLEDYKSAEEQYKEAIEINPNNVHVWTNLGKLYFEKNQPIKAEKALKQAINIDPKFPLSYLNLLELYENQGMDNEAQALWKRYRALNNDILPINSLKLKSKASKKKNK